MPAHPTVSFWRRSPPAVFPPVMGLFGLGLAWRRAGVAFDFAPAIGDLILGATTLIFLFLAAAHLAKTIARPATLTEDLRVLPGRTGLAAASLCVLLLAVAMLPYSADLARYLLIAGLIWHGLLAVILVAVLFSLPAEQRKTTSAWHLTFVGFIVGPLAAAPLGLTALAQVLFAGTVIIAAVIYAISAAQLIRAKPPPPLRPLLAIHLAPLSLFGTTAYLLGETDVAAFFAALATGVLAVLIAAARRLTSAGFSPLWGAFTFPLAAYSGLMLSLSGSGALFGVIGVLTLVAATLIVPVIAFRVLRLWSRGALAVATNASVA